MELLLIGIGGGLGAIMRFSLSNYIKKNININFPIDTMIINILGSFLLGMSIANCSNEKLVFFIQIGFCGAFTTFSTFMLDSFSLSKASNFNKAIFYLSTSILLSFISFLIAFSIKF